MIIAEILLIALGVSIDAAAVSVSGSLCPGKFTKRHCAINAALFFGGFQFIMPLIGFFTAGIFSHAVRHFDHYLAFALLLFVGGKMIFEACRNEEADNSCPLGEFFSARNLIIPAIATSIDALAIGAGLAFSDRGIWLPSAAMGIVTAMVSAVCVMLGSRLRIKELPAKKITILAGTVIILIGAKILLQDLGILF